MDRKEEYENFEQLLENHGAKAAIQKYYKDNARTIIIGVVSLVILIVLRTELPVGQRLVAIGVLLMLNYIYGKAKQWQQ